MAASTIFTVSFNLKFPGESDKQELGELIDYIQEAIRELTFSVSNIEITPSNIKIVEKSN